MPELELDELTQVLEHLGATEDELFGELTHAIANRKYEHCLSLDDWAYYPNISEAQRSHLEDCKMCQKYLPLMENPEAVSRFLGLVERELV